jgi:methionine sulfoxide reductase heme-binding subunit
MHLNFTLGLLAKTPNMQHLAWLKGLVFLLCLVPLMRLVWLGFNDDLGANPIEFIEHSTGFWALFILLITLSITPLKLMTGRAWVVQLRRMLGLYMFFYVCVHLLAYIWLDYSFDWQEIYIDIIKHPYVLVGFSAFLLIIPLAVTSNNAAMRKMRERWKALHKTVYLIAILGIVHFWWLVKKDITQPLLFALVLLLLFGIRIYYKKAQAIK